MPASDLALSWVSPEALASGLEEMSNEDVIRAAARLGEQINK